MKKRIRIADLMLNPVPDSCHTVAGWVRSVRTSGDIAFIMLNDGSNLSGIQLVIERNRFHRFEELSRIGTGASIRATGSLAESPATGQNFEIHLTEMEIIGDSTSDYPLQKKRHSFEYLRGIAHLRPRTNTFGAVFRLRSALAQAIHRFFSERGFLYVQTPIITSNDCEGAGEMFRVTTLPPAAPPRNEGGEIDFTQDFFARKTGLTVSGQLEGELFAQALGDIYTFGPTFRAENSNTPRHAAEFWMIEPEMAFADLDDNAELAEEFVRFLCSFTLCNCAEDISFFDKHVENGLIERVRGVAEASFGRMDYSEAIKWLKKAPVSFSYPVEWGLDLQTEHERYLTEHIAGGPLFVTNYPKDIKAFYMRQNDDGKTVAAMDLLVPKVGEIIGGSQREERIKILENRMSEMGIPKAPLWWYLDSRRWGSCPHSGFGLGFERLVMYLSGMENIRDVIPFPRTPRHAEF